MDPMSHRLSSAWQQDFTNRVKANDTDPHGISQRTRQESLHVLDLRMRPRLRCEILEQLLGFNRTKAPELHVAEERLNKVEQMFCP